MSAAAFTLTSTPTSTVTPTVPAGWSSPVTWAGDRRLEVAGALTPLFPDGGLRRGSSVNIDAAGAPGATLLSLALLSGPSQAGSWAGVVGFPALGLGAAAQAGIALDRLALVPDPGSQWPAVVAALVDSLDVVLCRLPAETGAGRRSRPSVTRSDARRLVARARERGAVLMTLGSGWPEPADVVLHVTTASWTGLGPGHGHLQARTVEVTASGRGGAARPRRLQLWLPGPDGTITVLAPAVAPSQVVAPAPVVGSAQVAAPASEVGPAVASLAG